MTKKSFVYYVRSTKLKLHVYVIKTKTKAMCLACIFVAQNVSACILA